MQVPALLGRSEEPYRSIVRHPIAAFDGSMLADASVVPRIVVPKLARKAKGALQALTVTNILDICARAGEIFAEDAPDGLSIGAFTQHVSLATGLPISVVRRGASEFFPSALAQMKMLLEAQLGDDLSILDTHLRERSKVRVGYVARGQNLGVVMPGNHPSTHVLWLIALALKMPVLLRPSYDDVFTPYRLAMSLYAAGLPPQSLSFVPGDHDLVDSLVDSCDLSVLFGGDTIMDRYGGRRDALVYGPGRSRALVLDAEPRAVTLDALVRLMVDEGGRGCINCSAILVHGDAKPLAEALADRLDALRALHPLNVDAILPAARSHETAERQTAYVDERAANAREWTGSAPYEIVDGATIQRPRLFSVDSPLHPLFGVEMPFPFAVIASVKSRAELVSGARGALAVVVIGDDEALVEELLMEPTIDKVYGGGALSTEFNPLEPHEGYLADFLFEHKAYRAGT